MLPPPSLPPPLFPLPVLLPLTCSSLTLLTQNVNLLAEKLLQRHLQTPTNLRGLSLQPFASTLKISELHLRDPDEKKPLISIPNASAKISFPHGIFNKTTNIDVNIESVLVSAILYQEKKKVSSNWTRLSERYKTDPSSSSTPPPPPSSSSSSSSGSTSNSPTFNLSLRIDKPKILLQNSKCVPIAPIISLPKLQVTSDSISSISNISHLVDGIITKVIRESKPRAFQSDVRDLLRAWLRNPQSSSETVDKAISWSRLNIPSLRKRLNQFDYYIDEVPGLRGIQSWTAQFDGLLQGAERILKPPRTEGESSSTRAPSTDQLQEHSQQDEKSREDPLQSPVEEFRELDEDTQ